MVRRRYNLGMYEKAVPAYLSWQEKLTACKEAGFDWLEISLDETEEKIQRLYWSQEEMDELLKATRQTGVPIWTMCFSCQRKYSLGTMDEEKKSRVMELMYRAVDFASYLGIRIIQLAGYDVYYEPSNQLTESLFTENLRKAVEYAAGKGVILAFETMMDRDFIDTVEKGMKYVNEANSPYLQMYPDIGNLTSAALRYSDKDVITDLKTGYGHIVAAHLKETTPDKDRNVPFGSGHTDFLTDIEMLRNLGVRMFNGEFWYSGDDNWKDNCRDACDFLRERLDEAFREAE